MRGIGDLEITVATMVLATVAAAGIWAFACTALYAWIAAAGRPFAIAIAIVGGTAAILVVPWLAVLFAAGGDVAPLSTVAYWAPVIAADHGFGLPIDRSVATQIGAYAGTLTVIGTAFCLSYAAGTARPSAAP